MNTVSLNQLKKKAILLIGSLALLSVLPAWSDVTLNTISVDFLSFEIQQSSFKYQFKYSFDKESDLPFSVEKKIGERFTVEYDELKKIRKIQKINSRHQAVLEFVIGQSGIIKSIRETLIGRGSLSLKFDSTGLIVEKKITLKENQYHYRYRHQNKTTEIDYLVNQQMSGRKKIILLGNRAGVSLYQVSYYDAKNKLFKYQTIQRDQLGETLISESVRDYLPQDRLISRSYHLLENKLEQEKFVIGRYEESSKYQDRVLVEKIKQDETARVVEKKKYFHQPTQEWLGMNLVDRFKNNWLEKKSLIIDQDEFLTQFSLYNHDQKIASILHKSKREGISHQTTQITDQKMITINSFKNDQIYQKKIKTPKGFLVTEINYLYNREGNLIEEISYHQGRIAQKIKYFYHGTPTNSTPKKTSSHALGLKQEQIYFQEKPHKKINYYLGKVILRLFQNKQERRKNLGLEAIDEKKSLKERFVDYHHYLSDKNNPHEQSVEKQIFDLVAFKRATGLSKIIVYNSLNKIEEYLRIESDSIKSDDQDDLETDPIQKIIFKYYRQKPDFRLIQNRKINYWADHPSFKISEKDLNIYSEDNRGSYQEFIQLAQDGVAQNQETLNEKITLIYRQVTPHPNQTASSYKMIKLKRELFDSQTGDKILDEIL